MSDDEDDYIAFGAPLKPLDDANIIRKKPIAVEEQIGKKPCHHDLMPNSIPTQLDAIMT